MCRDCQREYDDPNDRRFHAQPNACPACGPQLWLEDANGRIDCTDPLAETATRLKQGQIIATKGIGGFHLACDATDPDTVQKLRLRKRRRTKPFAIMAQHVQQIAQYCHLSDAEADLLSTPTAPIVLLETRQENTLPCIAPGLDRIGVMLPHAPVHHILLAEFDGPLVMTSGNLTQAPQITKNDDARRMLLDIADAVLMHDRDIVNRLDDSLIRMDHGAPTLLRRARGLAPSPILLHPDFSDAPPILAMGGELKSTFCLLRNGQAVPSEHIGDLTAAKTYADFREKIIRYSDLYDVTPTLIAADQNPDYLSTRWGQHLAHEIGATLVPVQHHHAHMISCLAEHRVPLGQDKSVGLILDGTGFGTDGTIWGGEILLGGYADFQRKAHLQPIALPGGAQAVREPWRNLVAHLSAAFGQDWEDRVAGTPIAAALAQKPTAMICQMIAQGVNAPLASSAGRMFDAVAAALGVAFDQQHYEGEAAMQLEAMVGSNDITEGYPAARSAKGVISWAPLWSALIADCRAGIDRGTIAARFHFGLADALADAVVTVASNGQTNRIVLSGGVMQNRLLHRHLTVKLQNQGMTVLSPVALPANDGGIALGQACCAAAQAISASN